MHLEQHPQEAENHIWDPSGIAGKKEDDIRSAESISQPGRDGGTRRRGVPVL